MPWTYAATSDLSSTLALPGIADAVPGPIATLLMGTSEQRDGDDVEGAEWLYEDPAAERLTVWTAVGMLVAVSAQNDADALATIRAWAYSHERSLDEVANSLVDSETPVESILTEA